MTVNGMTLIEVMEKLREPLSEEAFSDKFGYPALKYKAVVKRLDEVVSPCNYRFAIKKCEEVVVAGQPNVTTEGELSLLYDDGTVAFVAPAVGAARITLSVDDGEPINLANDREAAVHDCFKRCGKVLWIGSEQLEKMRKKKKKGTASAEEVSVKAILLRNFSRRGTGIASRVQIEGKEYDLVIWKEKHGLLEQCCGTVENFMKQCDKGKNLYCTGTFGTYNGTEQFVFSGFSKGKGEQS